MSDLVEWKKEDGSSIMLNNAPATVVKAKSLGWVRADEVAEGGDTDVENMSAAQLKQVFKDLGVDYPGNKEAAIEYLNSVTE